MIAPIWSNDHRNPLRNQTDSTAHERTPPVFNQPTLPSPMNRENGFLHLLGQVSARLTTRVRLQKSRKKHSTVRFKIGNLPRFYSRLAELQIPYVVLRWVEDVPLDPEAETRYRSDIDHLIGNDTIDQIRQIAADHPGRIDCDFYSVAGQRGTSYRRMPYYMPALAAQLLSRRELNSDGISVPCAEDAFSSFLYHLVYHKGLLSGIDTGFGLPVTTQPSRNYAAEVERLATLAGVELPHPYTLLGFHNYLKSVRWSMAIDLMPLWKSNQELVSNILRQEAAWERDRIEKVRGLTVFVMRSDCGGTEGEAIARKLIGERFQILQEVRLRGESLANMTTRTRGGQWFERGCQGLADQVLPTRAIICRNAATPGELPISLSPRKLKKRYPLLENTDVLIKHQIRERLRDHQRSSRSVYAIHSTDTPMDTLESLKIILGEQLDDFLKKDELSDQKRTSLSDRLAA